MTDSQINNRVDTRSNEQRYYDAIKLIARGYKKSHQFKDDRLGLSSHEELKMAYENIQWEAERAIKGKRRPK